MTVANERLNATRALLRFMQREGRVTPEATARLEGLASENGVTINEVLAQEGVVSEKDLAVLLAERLRLSLVNLTSFPLDLDLARTLKETLATKYDVVPLRLEGRSLEVADRKS